MSVKGIGGGVGAKCGWTEDATVMDLEDEADEEGKIEVEKRKKRRGEMW